ncbi:MAG: hypothetical protein A2Y76_02590 [Planctomycetes bacterium RBG_13_60_9]|nr:MAG: hypothetical protein A2Y76_02590 [Planctomycetes bacterium RBG_13_60_9]
MYLGVTVLLALLAFSSSATAADSEDLATEKTIGIGYEGMFLGEFLQGASVRGWLGKVGLEANVWQSDVGVKIGDLPSVDVSAFVLTGKIMYAPIVREHTKFYLGLQAGLGSIDLPTGTLGDIADADIPDTSIDVFVFGPLFGVEYRFQELPELGFNWEVGYSFSSLDMDIVDPSVDLNGISITLGVHYYFK